MSKRDALGVLPTGTVLGEAYRLGRRLAEGGMGIVYEAHHLRLGRRCAVKVMSRELAASADALARFHREAEITSQLAHPHIIHVLDFGTAPGGQPYLAMEYLDGEDLAQRLRRVGRLPLEGALRIVKQIASALAATHARGIVHRDLKPANVFLLALDGEPDFVKVVDFGISKIQTGTTSKLTRASVLMGTPDYMSPEQASGRVRDVDHRTDQWALACIAWELLTGASPFSATDVTALLYQVVHGEPQVQPRAAALSPPIETVLRRALAKRKGDRYPTIAAFARAFEVAANPAAAERAPLSTGRLRWAAGAAAAPTKMLAMARTFFRGRAANVPAPAAQPPGPTRMATVWKTLRGRHPRRRLLWLTLITVTTAAALIVLAPARTAGPEAAAPPAVERATVPPPPETAATTTKRRGRPIVHPPRLRDEAAPAR